MNTEYFDLPDNDKQKQDSNTAGAAPEGEDVQISLPSTDRPDGPFEHSAETSGWTKEEAKERKEEGEA